MCSLSELTIASCTLLVWAHRYESWALTRNGSFYFLVPCRATDRLQFKKEYELFKQKLSVVFAFLAIISLFINQRWVHMGLQLLLSYYYVTLGIRENILRYALGLHTFQRRNMHTGRLLSPLLSFTDTVETFPPPLSFISFLLGPLLSTPLGSPLHRADTLEHEHWSLIVNVIASFLLIALSLSDAHHLSRIANLHRLFHFSICFFQHFDSAFCYLHHHCCSCVPFPQFNLLEKCSVVLASPEYIGVVCHVSSR